MRRVTSIGLLFVLGCGGSSVTTEPTAAPRPTPATIEAKQPPSEDPARVAFREKASRYLEEAVVASKLIDTSSDLKLLGDKKRQLEELHARIPDPPIRWDDATRAVELLKTIKADVEGGAASIQKMAELVTDEKRRVRDIQDAEDNKKFILDQFARLRSAVVLPKSMSDDMKKEDEKIARAIALKPVLEKQYSEASEYRVASGPRVRKNAKAVEEILSPKKK
jgi:hypothetical protein